MMWKNSYLGCDCQICTCINEDYKDNDFDLHNYIIEKYDKYIIK